MDKVAKRVEIYTTAVTCKLKGVVANKSIRGMKLGNIK